MMSRAIALLALLTASLSAWAQGQAPQGQGVAQQPSKMLYAVADLVVPLPGLGAPVGDGDAKTKEDWLIRKIVGTIAPQSWQGKGGTGTIEYIPASMTLRVSQSAAVQAQVSDLLETMRRVQNVQVTLDMRVLTVGANFLDNLLGRYPMLKDSDRLILNENQVSFVLTKAKDDPRAEDLRAPKLTVFPGQKAAINVGDPTTGQAALDVRVKTLVTGDLQSVDLDVNGVARSAHFANRVSMLEGSTLMLMDRDRQATGHSVLLLVTPRVLIVPNELPTEPKPIPRAQVRPAPMMGEVVQTSATAIAPPPARDVVRQTEKQVTFKLRVCAGDPLGNHRTLAQPTMRTLENQPFAFHAGGSIPPSVGAPFFGPLGLQVQGTWSNVEDGKARVKLAITRSNRGDQTENTVHIRSESTHTILTVNHGETTRLRLGKKNGTEQTWLELTLLENE